MTSALPRVETPIGVSERPLWPAMRRGWARRCPNCGTGRMMDGYLAIHAACPTCGEDLHHHRADDGPAYMTILIVGHLLAPLLLVVFTHYRPEPLVLLALFCGGSVVLTLYLLPRIKGAFVAMQWAKRLYGFGPGI